MNQKIIRCLSCGLAFSVAAYSIVPYFLHCDDHWYCEPQEHIEVQNYHPYPSAGSYAQMSGTFTSATTLPPES